ncbi:MAG: hypothetical protein KF831_05105 [Acidobacteria bacterium]|nr:hypothetical protein [Acidobacteriota bacterium]
MKLLKLAFTLLLFTAIVFPQNPEDEKKKKAEELRAKAVEMLRETTFAVANLRTAENRISFMAELASLMWLHDRDQARAMYGSVVNDFKNLVAQVDTQMNMAQVAADADLRDIGPGPGMLTEPSDASRAATKFRSAMAVRQAIAMSLAEHEPELALSFYYDSISGITNARLLEMTTNDGYFEVQLLASVARKDAARAIQLARNSLKGKLNYLHIGLLREVYDKDQDKGVELAGIFLSKLKNDGPKDLEVYVAAALIGAAEDISSERDDRATRKPIYTQQELRELADLIGRAMLENDNGVDYGIGYISAVDKYAPSRAAQVRAKYKMGPAGRAQTGTGTGVGVYGASNAMANAANTMTIVDQVNSSEEIVAAEREREAREEAERKLMEDIGGLGKKELPKEERDRIVARAREIIMKTPGRDKKIMALSALAASVKQAGDAELAGEIMREAESFIRPDPRNYQDFIATWSVISGYAAAEPDRAFMMLDDTIYRANEVIAAFVRVGEFIDVTEQMIVDGEIQLGSFGGGMIRGLSSELNVAEATIGLLVDADLARTKAAADKFDRPETRVLARMMILRNILGTKATEDPEEVMTRGMK